MAMTESERLTEKRGGQNVIPLRQDGKTKWALTSAGMGNASTQFLYGTHADKLADYEAIGTVEELKTMKENGAFSGVELAQIAVNQMELKKYMEIGTVEELQALKEKNEPKKIVINNIPKTSWTKATTKFTCPSCDRVIGFNGLNYCSVCGQKLDWE